MIKSIEFLMQVDVPVKMVIMIMEFKNAAVQLNPIEFKKIMN